MQELNRGDKENVKVPGSKPIIASKPKNIPPANVALQKLVRDPTKKPTLSNLKDVNVKNLREDFKPSVQDSRKFDLRPEESKRPEGYCPYQETNQSQNDTEFDSCFPCSYNSACDNLKSSKSQSPNKSNDENYSGKKGTTSPSTVCCSILSNVGADCCGSFKEIKTVTKVESLDSNSSDSGGFSEFLQREALMKLKQKQQNMGRQSIPSLLDSTAENNNEFKQFGHQRKFSQPDIKPVKAATAQALEQFLMKSEKEQYRSSSPRTVDVTDGYKPFNVGKININYPVNSTSEEIVKKTSQVRQKGTKISSQSKFEQSTKKLEELLMQRLEKNEAITKNQSCLISGEYDPNADEKMTVQRQIHQKLQADLQKTVKQIQEIQSIELRLPQNRKWAENNRSQLPSGPKKLVKPKV